METNEIIVNEEVIETTEDLVKVSSGKGFKVAAGIGLAVIVGAIAYKYVAKPMLAKINTKKETQSYNSDFEDIEYDACSMEDETEEDEN